MSEDLGKELETYVIGVELPALDYNILDSETQRMVAVLARSLLKKLTELRRPGVKRFFELRMGLKEIKRI